MAILFGLTLIILVFIHFGKSREKNTQKASEEFWQREHESKFVPKKDISSLDYLTVPYASLPFRYWTPGADGPERISSAVQTPSAFSDASGDFSVLPQTVQESSYALAPEHLAPLSEELSEAERTICALSGSKILNLTGISNTELRLTYGTANLDPLTAYDQNFTVLIRALQKWGALLASAGNTKDAVTVLSYAVSIGSDIAGTYTLLAGLYKESGELQKISELRESAEQLSTLMKPSILRDLEQLLDSPEASQF
ncbi:MAG: hypothetical protein ACI4QX_10135 [Lachnospiraceae bacterium]